jgi:Kef-type K+ transport system membrane component KefB
VNGRRDAAIIGVCACLLSLGSAGVLGVLNGRPRSILIIPLAIAFFWGLAALAGSVLVVIFGERDEEPKRLAMFLAAVCATIVALMLLAVANSLERTGHVHAAVYGLRFLAGAGFWVTLGCLLGALFGKLPESEMAEGD